MEATYIVIIERHDLPRSSGRLYGAFVPDVPGCTAVGKSLDEALLQMRMVLAAAVRRLCRAGQEIPHAHSLEEHQAQYSCNGETLLREHSVVALIDVSMPAPQLALAA
jgi:predicted RNase H-like HicB family nuclease